MIEPKPEMGPSAYDFVRPVPPEPTPFNGRARAASASALPASAPPPQAGSSTTAANAQATAGRNNSVTFMARELLQDVVFELQLRSGRRPRGRLAFGMIQRSIAARIAVEPDAEPAWALVLAEGLGVARQQVFQHRREVAQQRLPVLLDPAAGDLDRGPAQAGREDRALELARRLSEHVADRDIEMLA